ncbi:MAG: NAD-binding protein [Pseudomonadales bacterium]
MAKGSDLDRVTAIVLREMRGPIFLLISVYAVGIVGMVAIPGQDAHGNPAQMSFFHALYFMSYTATTTGFGELPAPFTEPQRMWAIACLLLSVVTWVYAIGAIARLVTNPFFTQSLAQRRFSNSVRRIREPFVIICGFGDTGSLLARGLSEQGMAGVVVDIVEDRIKALGLRHYTVPMPGLWADASVPANLTDAGLDRPECRAVVVLTPEDVGLKIAVMTRLLNPQARIVCRCPSRLHEEELHSLGSVIIADPFEAYARELALALRSPPLHTLDEWLVGARGVSLRRPLRCPLGTWVLCGYGRMGRWVHHALSERGVDTVVVAAELSDDDDIERKVVGVASRTALIEAGVESAAGVVAATGNDTNNLSILINARALNPDVFLVVRQNRHENELAFTAARADLIMQPSLVSARRILLTLISPLIEEFLVSLEQDPACLLNVVYPRLLEIFDGERPSLWVTEISSAQTPAVAALLEQGPVTLGDILRDPRDPDVQLRCVALLLDRDGEQILMPDTDQALHGDDRLLFCAVPRARRVLQAALTNEYTLSYLITGRDPPRGWLARWLNARSAPSGASETAGL